MKKTKCYENYPVSTNIVALLFEISIYTTGALIVYRLGLIWMALYLAIVIIFVVQLLRKSCVNCYYYGKSCFSGKGRLCSLFFKKGNPKKFAKKKITFLDILPDMLISLVPSIIGIVLLIMHFDWILLMLVLVLFLLAFPGNGYVRGKLACVYCKQRSLGCPAERLFNKKK